MTPVPLWKRSFVLWLIGSAQSRFAAALASIALSFLVLHQTGQAGQMAVTLACALIPNLVMPLAGAWVDRIGLKRPLIGANIVRGLLQLTVGGLALLGQQTGHDVPLWIINGAAFLTGLASSVASPAAGAALPALVAPADLPCANGVMGSLAETMGLLGTFSGGLLVAAFSPAIAILLDGLSFLLMAALLLGVTLPNRGERGVVPSNLWRDLWAGLRLMRRSRVLTVVPLLALLINTPLGTLLQQGVPAAYLGRVFAVLSAVGAVGMPLTLLLVSPLVDRWPLALWFGLNALGLALGGAVWGVLMRLEPRLPALSEGPLPLGEAPSTV